MKKTKLCMSLMIILLPLLSSGQLSIVGVQNFPDTAYFNERYDFLITVKNTGSSTYFGRVEFDFQSDSMKLAGITKDLLKQDLSTFTIPPGATMDIPVMNYLFPPMYYREEENNGVLIWPREEPADTVEENVYIRGNKDSAYTAVIDGPDLSGMSIYPNPSGGVAYISQDRPVEWRIVVYDIRGSVAKKLHSDKLTIMLDMTAAKPGAYFIHMISNEGQVTRKRLFIE